MEIKGRKEPEHKSTDISLCCVESRNIDHKRQEILQRKHCVSNILTMAKENSDSIWLYSPSFALSIVAAVLYSIPMALQFWQTVIRYKAYYFIVVLVGACLEVGGYAARAISIKQSSQIVSSLPLNIFQC